MVGSAPVGPQNPALHKAYARAPLAPAAYPSPTRLPIVPHPLGFPWPSIGFTSVFLGFANTCVTSPRDVISSAKCTSVECPFGRYPLSEMQIGSADVSARPAAIKLHHESDCECRRAVTFATFEESPFPCGFAKIPRGAPGAPRICPAPFYAHRAPFYAHPTPL